MLILRDFLLSSPAQIRNNMDLQETKTQAELDEMFMRMALQEARAAELEKARRNLQTTYGELLEAMGFAPTHAVALSRNDMTLELPQATMEELILQALSSHPSLSIADRAIVMQENAVRKAIADFLPTLGAFVHKGWSSDSFTTPARTLYGGFSAAMDLFKCFANTLNRFSQCVRFFF